MNEMKRIPHPSHLKHKLFLLRKPSSFSCDACGEFGEDRNLSYICIICQYWIHEQCALLPPTIENDNHQHPLSVAFRLPQKYSKFQYICDICSCDFSPQYWVYHCEICSYVVHIKCGLQKKQPSGDLMRYVGDLKLPVDDVSEELIKPFVMSTGGKIQIPEDINGKYKFHNHHHELSLVSSEQNNDIDDDDYVDHGRRSSDIMCDGCTTPIIHKKKHPSPSSSSQKCYYYNCRQCNYFLHLSCFNLPSELPYSPFHRPRESRYSPSHIQLQRPYLSFHRTIDRPHSLVLKSSPDLKLKVTRCDVCHLYTNGLFYSCTVCYKFTIDIKCASLCNGIKHAAHPQHSLTMIPPRFVPGRCSVCGERTSADVYTCREIGCGFQVHHRCVLLPAANQHSRDKHTLPLTYNAGLYHPGEFNCDVCEEEMDPKRWMYYCRECDQSIHPDCLPATSGRYRNIKFGQQFVADRCHDPHHTLTYQLIARKRCCDICGEYRNGEPGFQCGSCNFVMCIDPCGRDREDAIQAIHW